MSVDTVVGARPRELVVAVKAEGDLLYDWMVSVRYIRCHGTEGRDEVMGQSSNDGHRGCPQSPHRRPGESRSRADTIERPLTEHLEDLIAAAENAPEFVETTTHKTFTNDDLAVFEVTQR